MNSPTPSPWTFSGPAPSWAATSEVVTLVDGNAFCISDQAGDITPGAVQGLFFHDIRMLSRWELYLDGRRMEGLSFVPADPFSGDFVSRLTSKENERDSALVVKRSRQVSQGLRDEITISNFGSAPSDVTITMVVATDFADVFAVKGRRVGELANPVATAHSDQLTISDPAQNVGVVVRASNASPCHTMRYTNDTVTFTVTIPPKEQWSVCLEAIPILNGVEATPNSDATAENSSAMVLDYTHWRNSSASFRTNHPVLRKTLARTSSDLGSLRLADSRRPGLTAIAAGAPWYMTLFGRDSLLTSWMALLLDPQLAIGTTYALAELQGRVVDPTRDEEPGKIIHEIRHIVEPGNKHRTDDIYYGTADATPLFVMLIGELYRWGFADQVRALLPNVDRAMDWIENYGDRDGDGFVEYLSTSERGLKNHGWKDSFDGISFADGRIAEPATALVEVQAYVYAAYLARADIAHAEGEFDQADHYRSRAKELKHAFNERFWLPEKKYFAVALDHNKQQVDSLTSNIGHCLWTGILDEDKARYIADVLLSPDIFSGWGIRTLARNAIRYNPASYHNGSVWPHDTALAVTGLMRYGFVEHAHQIVRGLLDVADHRSGRLPELFCGFDRQEFSIPVSYPAACSPQAWAAAAPLLLVRAMLQFEPNVPAGVVSAASAIPDEIGEIAVEGIALGKSRVTVAATRGRVSVTGLPAAIRLKEVRNERSHPGWE